MTNPARGVSVLRITGRKFTRNAVSLATVTVGVWDVRAAQRAAALGPALQRDTDNPFRRGAGATMLSR